MSRKINNVSLTRKIQPDKRHNNLLAAKFVNCMMHHGKKSLIEHTFYGALDRIRERMKESVEPIEVFSQAVENVKPVVEVKSRRVGGANYQVPVEVRPERRQALAIRWLIEAARKRNEKTMIERLSNELMDAYSKSGSAVKKKEDVHRMAEANKAFAHYRW